MTKLLFMIPQK